MRKLITALIILIIIVGGGFAAWWFLTDHGNKSPSTNTTSSQSNNSAKQKQQADETAAKTEIKTNWEKFFNGTTSAQEKINLLQNGQEFAQVIQAQAGSQTAQSTTATVADVDVNGNTATVTYSVNLNGQPALSNQKGQAVKENGTWKVSDTAFCGLLQLSGNVPPNCPNTGSGTQQSQTQTQTQTPPANNSGQ